MSIGKPSPKDLSQGLDRVKQHIESWRRLTVGEVEWQPLTYRAAASPIEVPTFWKLRRPSEWLEACGDKTMRSEFERTAKLIEITDACFHSFWIRYLKAWREKPIVEVVQAGRLAKALEPNCAGGSPLRMLSMEGIDTKFFERHAGLLTKLLDRRFDGEVGRIGLENFLGALIEDDRWVLLIDLDGQLLPFPKQRVRTSDLMTAKLACERLLIVENEKCQHHLPQLAGCLAILGAGFDLRWMQASWLDGIDIAYWGDIDTWGLSFLSRARKYRPELQARLMTEEIYESHLSAAVVEKITSGPEPLPELLPSEQSLYRRLLRENRGRLEQEFIDRQLLIDDLLSWEKLSSASL
jgi:hypothetical protein